MKKYLLGLLICLFPIFLSAKLSCDIKVLGVSESSVSLCVGDDLPLDGTPAGGTLPYTHLWMGAGGQLSTTTMQSTIFTATTAGVYTVVYQVTDNTLPVNQVATDTIIITVNSLPNLFSLLTILFTLSWKFLFPRFLMWGSRLPEKFFGMCASS